jgi:hypothetical protein
VSYSFNAYPNPFNPVTTLTFGIEHPGEVRIELFNVAGQHVRELVNQHYETGTHQVVLDAKELPSGIYFAQLQAGAFVAIEKVVLMK